MTLLKVSLSMWFKKQFKEVTLTEDQRNEIVETWVEAGVKTLDDLGSKIKESDVQKVPRFSALDPEVQQRMLEATRKRLQESPHQATLNARMTTLLGHQPEQMHLDLVETAVTQEFSMSETLREQEEKGMLRECCPEEPLWHLLQAQKGKDSAVINYINFSSQELLVKGSEDAPPGLQDEPDPEVEHDALRIPSYEAWRKAFRRWATVAVAYNQITQEFAKNYEEHIVKLVEKLDRQGSCQI